MTYTLYQNTDLVLVLNKERSKYSDWFECTILTNSGIHSVLRKDHHISDDPDLIFSAPNIT